MKNLFLLLLLFITSCSLQKEPLSDLVNTNYAYLIKKRKVKVVETKKEKISKNDILFKYDPNIEWYFIDKIDSIREFNNLETNYHTGLEFEYNKYLIYQIYEVKDHFKEKNKIYYLEEYSDVYETSKECLDYIFYSIIENIDEIYEDLEDIAILFLHSEDFYYISIIIDGKKYYMTNY